MTLQNIEIKLEPAERRYKVCIGAGALKASADQLSQLVPRGLLPVITDENLARLHLPTFEANMAEVGIETRTLILPPGESSKSFSRLEQVCNFLLAQDMERDDVLAAFGGGVIGDLAGLASALVKRGTGYVQIPTTLLAQVDSSVGGKTAINTQIGKNMIGVFHQPKLVIADVDLLQTLGKAQMRAGYAEIIKMACLSDADLFASLEGGGPELLEFRGDDLTEIIARSVQGKAGIVIADEFEHGSRALLNLGHTFAHALESEASGKILHGEAVAAGVGAAFCLSVELGLCPPNDRDRVLRHLKRMGLPSSLAEANGGKFEAEKLLQRMKADKKNQHGQIRLILCKKIGEAFVMPDLAEEHLLRFIKANLT